MATTVTLAEALTALKGADEGEVRREIEILEKENAVDLERIAGRKRLIRTLRKLAGLSDSAEAPTVPNDGGREPSPTEAKAAAYLRHAGPSLATKISADTSLHLGILTALMTKRPEVFEKLPDGKWKLKSA